MMSKPFFIWTMRRTGGTSITGLLMHMSEYNTIEHEPFNPPRLFGNIIKDFRSGKDHKLIADEIDNALASKPLIKHCYEVFGEEFNGLIIDAALKQDYKHLFLKREDEVSRIISLFLAMQTSVWGLGKQKQIYGDIFSGKLKLKPFNIDRMIKHTKECNSMTSLIQKNLIENGQEFKVVSFEELYIGDRNVRMKKLNDIFSFIELDNNVVAINQELIETNIFNKSQNSQSILEYVPNYKEAIDELRSI